MENDRRRIVARWEVWTAYSLYRDSSAMKMRPVIIYEPRNDMIPCIELTTHAPRQWLIWQYPLQNWREAGLDKPSTAVLNNLVTIPREALGRRIGELSFTDRANIECMIAQEVN